MRLFGALLNLPVAPREVKGIGVADLGLDNAEIRRGIEQARIPAFPIRQQLLDFLAKTHRRNVTERLRPDNDRSLIFGGRDSVFERLGADEDRMETMRNTALKLCKGWDRAQMARLVDEAMEEVIDPIVYREALDEMAAHRAAGHKVFVVSASPEEIVRPLARHLGADGSVASTAKVDSDGRFTGEMDFYSYGPYKVDAMEALALEHDLDLDQCYAYSDSITDLPMLEAVGHPIVVNPDRALARIASEREWEVRWFSNKVSLRSRVGQHARTGAVIAGAGALAGGAGWLYRNRRARA